MKCTSATRFHRKSGGAEWRDLLFIIRSNESEWKRYRPLCHPDRSVAKWRDLQFRDLSWKCFFLPGRSAAERTTYKTVLVTNIHHQLIHRPLLISG